MNATAARLGLCPDDLTALQWRDSALCAQTDPDAFFPDKGGATRVAKRVCAHCEVRGDCLDYALAHKELTGIWGGLSETERDHLRTQRAATAQAISQPTAAPVPIETAQAA